MSHLTLTGAGKSGAGITATYTVTTTGAQTHTIQSFGVSAPTVVDWGDGSRNTYSGTALRTHNYTGAGTWLVTIYKPQNVTTFDMRDNKVNLNSADIASMVNVTQVVLTALRSGRFDSADVSAWRPTDFRLYSMPAGYAGTFDSADVSDWRPTNFSLYSMPAGYAGTFDSADVSAWRPTTFYLRSMPAGYAGTFDSADVSDWRPTTFSLYYMPAGYAGTFDSADVSDWRPTTFDLYYMPAGYAGTFDSADVSAWRPTTFYLRSMPAGYAGTFDSADVSAWRPTDFRLYSMPAGYAGTFDSVDVSAWRPTTFYLHSMPAGYAGTFNSADVSAWRPATFYLYSMPAGYTITPGGGWANWNTTTDFRVLGNGLLTATVDAILWELYQATLSRTVTGGIINVGGSNQAPSGTFQAATACPVTAATPGKEVAHELLNDGCNAIAAGETWATVTFTV